MSRSGAVEAIRRHPLLAAWLATTGVLAIVQTRTSSTGSDAIFVLVLVVSTAAIAVGPVLRRAPVRRPYRWLMLAAVLFAGGTVLHAVPRHPSTLLVTAVTLGGYLAGAAFLWDLLRAAQGGSDELGLQDAAMIATGAALALWSGEMAPALFAGHEPIGQTLVTAGFPLVDAVVVALSTRLAMQARQLTPALWALMAGTTAMVLGDTAAYVVEITADGPAFRWIRVLYLASLAFIAVAMAHPSMVHLGERGVTTDGKISRARRVSMIAAILLPGAVALLAPSAGGVDLLVRVVLMGTLLGIAQLRLMRTISALERAQDLTRYQASHDSLTGLQNRPALLAEVRHRLGSAPGDGWVGVLCLDADSFAQVNDTWGHAAGDELLCTLATRLRGAAGPTGAAFRTAGDGFAVVFSGSGAQDGVALAGRVRAAVQEPFLLSGERRVTLTVTMGLAHSPVGEDDAAELVRNADTALSRAEQDGPASLAVFDGSLRDQLHDRLLLAEDLRVAVDRGQLDAHFQPIHGGPGYGQLIGFEALARWTHPERGPISPVVFVPLAEDTGSIVEIGEFMMRRACFQLAAWRATSGADLHVSVNVSLAQITRSDVASMVEAALTDSGLPAQAVWVEITESLMAERSDVVIGTLQRLKALGVVLALDDFGTGYSSLSCIADFPIDVVKVDRSFVSRLPHDSRTAALTQLIIDMVRSLHLIGVVAEGVEEREQGEALAAMGCTWVQGWLYGRPLPAASIDLAAARPEAGAPTTATDTTATAATTPATATVPAPRPGQGGPGRVDPALPGARRA